MQGGGGGVEGLVTGGDDIERLGEAWKELIRGGGGLKGLVRDGDDVDGSWEAWKGLVRGR